MTETETETNTGSSSVERIVACRAVPAKIQQVVAKLHGLPCRRTVGLQMRHAKATSNWFNKSLHNLSWASFGRLWRQMKFSNPFAASSLPVGNSVSLSR